MTSFNYARMKKTADRLITRFGKKAVKAVLIEPGISSGHAFDPTQGAPTLHTVNAAVLNYDTRDIDGNKILANDKRVLIAVDDLNIIITTSWKLRLKMKGDASSKDHTIIVATPTEPGDVTLLWELQCRAA